MANTYKTNKARMARILNRRFKEKFNERDYIKAEKIEKEIESLEVNAVRYGKNRKQKARDKVIDRQKERRVLNKVVEKELKTM